jgi:hypothetical protein
MSCPLRESSLGPGNLTETVRRLRDRDRHWNRPQDQLTPAMPGQLRTAYDEFARIDTTFDGRVLDDLPGRQ